LLPSATEIALEFVTSFIYIKPIGIGPIYAVPINRAVVAS
jgi:hypothetical protein